MNVAIDIVSDLVCPWCFIGKARLKGALALVKEKHPDVEFQISWLPYFLNPDTPKAGESYRGYLESKFGGAKEVDRIQANVAEAGRDACVEFRFDRIATRPNTLRAHRLVRRRRAGRIVYYALDDDHVLHLLGIAGQHAAEAADARKEATA